MSDNSSPLQAEGQVVAPSLKVRMLDEFADQAGDVCQSGLDVAVTWCINRQFVENARNAAPLQQLSPFGVKQVDASSDSVETGFSPLVAVGEIAAQASFHSFSEDLRDQRPRDEKRDSRQFDP